jgi:hypothetical protein
MPDRLCRRLGRRTLLGAGAIAAGASLLPACVHARPRLPVRQPGERPTPVLNLRAFGAKGDGKTDDTDAFARAAAAINAAGRGTLLIPPGTYIVGRQTAGAGNGRFYKHAPILRIAGCGGPVAIEGLGHGRLRPVLKAADGLRFGSFDPGTGERYDPAQAVFTDDAYRADAYQGMVELRGNASVVVSHLELDGNAAGLVLGGKWGDDGRQCAAYGIFADSCGEVVVADVDTHHHGLDGISIGADDRPGSDVRPHALYDVVSEHNARQGLSWVGSSGLFAARCRFSLTGDTGVHGLRTNPSAGVDVEPQNGAPLRGGVFEDCEMLGNYGTGFSADRGAVPVSDVLLKRCTIGGTRSWSAFVHSPDFRFDDCRLVGPLNTNVADLPDGSIVLTRCEVTDEGAPYTGEGVGNLIDAIQGTTFDRCTLTAASQRIGSLSRARVTNTRFVAKVPTEVIEQDGDNWLVLLYFGPVTGCTFEDALPSGGGPITVNYGSNSAWEGNAVVPGGRLALLKVS